MLILCIFRRLNFHVLKKYTFLLIFCFGAVFFKAQSVSFSNSVRVWALLHPVAAGKIKKIDQQCDSIYKTVNTQANLDNYSSGGQLDAFRHIFYFSAFAQKIGSRKLRKLGIAYENKNYKQFLSGENKYEERHDSLAMVMDLRNNELAFEQALNFSKLELTAMRDSVIKMITEGKAWILLRNKSGNYLQCDGRIINMGDYKNRWFVPKCLVKSNTVYKD